MGERVRTWSAVQCSWKLVWRRDKLEMEGCGVKGRRKWEEFGPWDKMFYIKKVHIGTAVIGCICGHSGLRDASITRAFSHSSLRE